ncbi:MAG: GNAT family N-acetyltransferase [Chloroflexota bacterium]|nr:GNAT family N-acetyltransferase [Chloroflexota bacterium]
MLRPSLAIRPARAADQAAVLAFTTATWSWGDYLAEVWDSWLAEEQGVLAVGEAGGRVVGVDKLTFLSPTEAFFQGLRIDPAVRGRGYAQAFQHYMLAEAARQGARVVRLITAHDNSAIHHMAERDGFVRGPSLVPWRTTALPAAPDFPATLLTPGSAAAAAWADLPTGPLWVLLGGRVVHHWQVQAWTTALWTAWVAAEAVWSTPDGGIVLAPARPGSTHRFLAGLHPTAAQPAALTALAHTACRLVPPGTALQALLPPDPTLTAALTAAGWTADAADAQVIFEKAL